MLEDLWMFSSPLAFSHKSGIFSTVHFRDCVPSHRMLSSNHAQGLEEQQHSSWPELYCEGSRFWSLEICSWWSSLLLFLPFVERTERHFWLYGSCVSPLPHFALTFSIVFGIVIHRTKPVIDTGWTWCVMVMEACEPRKIGLYVLVFQDGPCAKHLIISFFFQG